MVAKTWPKCSLSAIFDDNVVYRNLAPLDNRIPGLDQVWRKLGLRSGVIPRKAKDEAYVGVLHHFLDCMQEARGAPPLERLLYVGNRLERDQSTLRHLEAASPLRVMTFLCEESVEGERRVTARDGAMIANRWDAIADFSKLIQRSRYPLDERVAVIVDMDKTIVAARGRNDGPLNQSRVEGVKLTVQELLGDRFEARRFEAAYAELNQPKYHFFTEDNQDYVTYIALMASALVYPVMDLLEDLAFGRLDSFAGYLQATGERLAQHPMKELWMVYQEVSTYSGKGDPTVFKSFRTRQFESTLARIDRLPGHVDEATLLAEEIVITREILDFCRLLKGRNACLLMISDRPDESLIPDVAMAARGYLPFHRAPMKVVGTPVYDRLQQMALP